MNNKKVSSGYLSNERPIYYPAMKGIGFTYIMLNRINVNLLFEHYSRYHRNFHTLHQSSFYRKGRFDI